MWKVSGIGFHMARAMDAGEVNMESAAYGIGNWQLMEGNRRRAIEIFREIRQKGNWAAFGYLAAEADMQRIYDRSM